jgi:tetratricopeptide (TPR) repeat protein
VALMADPAAGSVETACGAGECEQAIGLLEEAVRRQPTNPMLHYRLGVCYSGGCHPHSLTHPDMAVSYFRQALRLFGPAAGLSRAAVLEGLGNTLLQSRLRPPETSLRDAVNCHREAARIYESAGNPDDWARANFNLGNSCCELSEVTGEDHWREAVARYEQSLRVRTRQRDPERYAAVLENLGTAYRRLSTDAAANIRKSIQCYRRALGIFGRGTHPGKYAALQNNLGNAFLSLPDTGEGSAARNARRALHHFERALRVQSGGRRSRAYGITQYNRAQAYVRLACSAPSVNLELAVGCLEEACAAFCSCGEERYSRLARAQLDRIRLG